MDNDSFHLRIRKDKCKLIKCKLEIMRHQNAIEHIDTSDDRHCSQEVKDQIIEYNRKQLAAAHMQLQIIELITLRDTNKLEYRARWFSNDKEIQQLLRTGTSDWKRRLFLYSLRELDQRIRILDLQHRELADLAFEAETVLTYLCSVDPDRLDPRLQPDFQQVDERKVVRLDLETAKLEVCQSRTDAFVRRLNRFVPEAEQILEKRKSRDDPIYFF